MSYHFQKHFTLDEANALIPHVRKLFAEVLALLESEDESFAEESPYLSRPHGNGKGNGHSGNGHANGKGTQSVSPTGSQYNTWSTEKRREAAYRLLNALQQQGIVIQDVERGLIDFPSIVNEKEVFLCYELTDGHSIGYYHELDAGYAGRQRLPGEYL